MANPLLTIEWIFLPHQMTKTIVTQHEMFAQIIIKAQQQLQMLAGCDFEQISIITVYQDVALEGHIQRGLSWKAPGISLASVRACNRDAESSCGRHMAVRGQQGQAGGARDWERTGGADCALFPQPEHCQPGGLPPCPPCCYTDCGK